MDHIAGIGSACALMAFGTDIRMPADGIQWGIVMRDTGYRFPAVALAAGKVGPDCVNVSGLIDVTVLAPPVFVELDTLMRVSQARAYTHFG